MISTALVADAVIGNVQEKTMKQYHAGNAEVIFYSYGIGTMYLLIGLWGHEQLLGERRLLC